MIDMTARRRRSMERDDGTEFFRLIQVICMPQDNMLSGELVRTIALDRYPTQSVWGKELSDLYRTGASTPASAEAEESFFLECFNCRRLVSQTSDSSFSRNVFTHALRTRFCRFGPSGMLSTSASAFPLQPQLRKIPYEAMKEIITFAVLSRIVPVEQSRMRSW
jgi:hypothetical protein